MALENAKVIGDFNIIQYAVEGNRFVVDPIMTRDPEFVASLDDEIKQLVETYHNDVLAGLYAKQLNSSDV